MIGRAVAGGGLDRLEIAVTVRTGGSAYAWRWQAADGALEGQGALRGGTAWGAHFAAVAEALARIPKGRPVEIAVRDATIVRAGEEWIPDWRAKSFKKKGGIAEVERVIAADEQVQARPGVRWVVGEISDGVRELAREAGGEVTSPTATVEAELAARSATVHRAMVAAPAAGCDLVAWADGGCRGNPGGIGGWGMLLVDPARDVALSRRGGAEETTNNRMEMTAAIQVLQALKGSRAIEIRSDSRYLVDLASKWMASWKKKGWRRAGPPGENEVKNLDLVQEIDRLCAVHQVTWTWVRGHNGDFGNEWVDRLANQAMDAQRAGRETTAEERIAPSPVGFRPR